MIQADRARTVRLWLAAVEPPSVVKGLDLAGARGGFDDRFALRYGPGSPRLADRASAPWLGIDRLVCYRVALEFLSAVPRLVPARGCADLRDQLERASTSIVLCIAEGAGRVSQPDRARFFAIAHGSATECAAIVDILRVRRLAPTTDRTSARALLVRIVQMLSKLIVRQRA